MMTNTMPPLWLDLDLLTTLVRAEIHKTTHLSKSHQIDLIKSLRALEKMGDRGPYFSITNVNE